MVKFCLGDVLLNGMRQIYVSGGGGGGGGGRVEVYIGHDLGDVIVIRAVLLSAQHEGQLLTYRPHYKELFDIYGNEIQIWP